MAVNLPREKWNDNRLDDLKKSVHDGFARVDRDISEFRSEMKSEMKGLRGEMKRESKGLRDELKSEKTGLRDELRSEMKGLREEMNQRFSSQEHSLYAATAVILAAIIGTRAF